MVLVGAACMYVILWYTLSDHVRPHLFPYPSIDRVCAFATVGVLFGMAFPRQIGFVLIFVIFLALGSEALQVLRPGRDPRILDAIAKVLGCVLGVILARLINRSMPNLGRDFG